MRPADFGKPDQDGALHSRCNLARTSFAIWVISGLSTSCKTACGSMNETRTCLFSSSCTTTLQGSSRPISGIGRQRPVCEWWITGTEDAVCRTITSSFAFSVACTSISLSAQILHFERIGQHHYIRKGFY